MSTRRVLWLVLAAALLAVRPAQAITIFLDDFNSETLGLNQSLDNWTITDGSIDVIGPGFIDLCTGAAGAGSSSNCVDLDGSTGNAVTMNHAFSLAPGDYSLTYLLAGSQRGDSNTVNVSLGGLFSDTHTLASAAGFAQFGGFFSVLAPTNVSLVFEHLGGDNLGLLLDNVRLELRENGDPVPEPTTLLLLSSGIGAAAWRRRVKQRRHTS